MGIYLASFVTFIVGLLIVAYIYVFKNKSEAYDIIPFFIGGFMLMFLGAFSALVIYFVR